LTEIIAAISIGRAGSKTGIQEQLTVKYLCMSA